MGWMKLNDVEPGLNVRIVKNVGTAGMVVNPKNLLIRAVGKTGIVQGWVPGHGGDVWWIKHDDGSGVGAYMFDEFEELQEQNRDTMILPPIGKILVEMIDSESEMIGEFVAGILDLYDGSQVLPGTKVVISDHGGESFEYLGKSFVVCTQSDVLGIIKEGGK